MDALNPKPKMRCSDGVEAGAIRVRSGFLTGANES